MSKEKLQKVTEKQALETITRQEAKEDEQKQEAQKEEQATKTKTEAKTEVKTEEAKTEEAKQIEKTKREVIKERKYTVSLFKAYRKPAPKRANTAIKILRAYIARHLKTKQENVKINPKVQNFIYNRGHTKPVKSIKIRVSLDKQEIAQVDLE